MKRLDQRLVDLGFASSRNKAQQLIEAEEVELLIRGAWKVITQASFKSNAEIRLSSQNPEILKYVSRGGLKLEGALKHTKLNVTGFRCLDVGLSTGGFSDCLLQSGASDVAGVDVGREQLASPLKSHPRLKYWEGVHAKELPTHKEIRKWLEVDGKEILDLCVVDVSFISLTNILTIFSSFLPPETRLLALVKPQFEVGSENLNRRGVVVNPKFFDDVKSRILHALDKCDFSAIDYFPSDLKGQDGNQEFFVYALKRAQKSVS